MAEQRNFRKPRLDNSNERSKQTAPSKDSSRTTTQQPSPYQQITNLTNNILNQPVTGLPPVPALLQALGRGAMEEEVMARVERGDYTDAALPQAVRWQPASVLARKLEEDLHQDLLRERGLKTVPPTSTPHDTSSGDVITHMPVDVPIVSPQAPRPLTAQTHPQAVSAVPKTTIVGTELAFGKSHQVINISNDYSDGDANAILPAGYEVQPTQRARRDLATAWMKAQGLAQPDQCYMLDELPAHYFLAKNPKKPSDRHVYVFGHPNGQQASSATQFYPHFEHIKMHSTSQGCNCKCCSI